MDGYKMRWQSAVVRDHVSGTTKSALTSCVSQVGNISIQNLLGY